MNLTGAQALVRVLAAERVSFAFGVVGGKLAPLLHAIRGEQSIRYVGTRHEAAGAMMAAAVFAGSGRMAVALGEMGPGGLNLAVRRRHRLQQQSRRPADHHQPASRRRLSAWRDVHGPRYRSRVLRPLTKWNAVVHDPRRMPELARRAFREALSGRPGPVHLDVPQDVLAAECSFADDEFDLPPARYRVDRAPARRCRSRSRQPPTCCGGRAARSSSRAAAWWRAAPSERLRELAGILQAPVVPTQMALGAVATDSPHFIGHGGIIGGDAVREAFAQSDTILAVGCRFSSWMWDQPRSARCAGTTG